MPDPLPADLAAALAGAAPRLGAFRVAEYFDEIGSTNDVALKRAGLGAPHGTVILADAQVSGRGRQGRAWFSPPGSGVYLSAIVRQESWAGALSLVTLAAGVAVARGLSKASGLSLELKWPNDVVIGRPWRKIAGILSESASAGPRIDAVVVGIGINVRVSAFPPDIADRATALEKESYRPVDVSACIVEVLAALSDITEQLAGGNRAAIVDAWRHFARPGLAGAAVRWSDEHGTRRGLAADVDETGALLVMVGDRIERVVAGEVQWERLSRE
ncbi:MAG TPA: biotin--[acetyl-CoA-carboxylase] ligase [Vicinamibacterales bacterium]|nr:biotin--[acetyl-CoA-carboxylase] ligase [Vicinamibacterales bacterium]